MLHAHLDGATLPAIGGPPALPVDHPPLLLVVIDTEEEFDWHLPHSRDNTSVSAIAAQGPAQQIFARHDIVPTYVVDYPVATTPAAVAVLKSFFDQGACRIGTHLHPWVNPPFQEVVNATNSYPGNLRSEEHTSELQSLMRISYAVFCLKKKIKKDNDT